MRSINLNPLGRRARCVIASFKCSFIKHNEKTIIFLLLLVGPDVSQPHIGGGQYRETIIGGGLPDAALPDDGWPILGCPNMFVSSAWISTLSKIERFRRFLRTVVFWQI